MPFQNLNIARIIVHEVYQRSDDRQIVTPLYGADLVTLNGEALDAFRDRISSAVGSTAKCMELDIVQSDADCSIAIAKELVDADQQLFVDRSRAIADKLAAAQTRRDIPGGVVAIFSGSAGYPPKRILGIIKAETHNGFTRQKGANGRITLQFLNNLLLTPQTKLYKIGVYIEADPGSTDPFPAGWRAFVYDHLIGQSNKLTAAQYFYESFLGCGFPESSARRTREFHDYTREFIQRMDWPEDRKADLHNALVTYLKVNQGSTLQVAEFANTYLPGAELRDSFTKYMTDKRFPLHAISKDLTDVLPVLKLRKITFAKKIRITGPADDFGQLVHLKEIDGKADGDGQIPVWTEVIIRDRIMSQE